jgi:hypothetical protein
MLIGAAMSRLRVVRRWHAHRFWIEYKMQFGHEQLGVLRVSIQYVAWAYKVAKRLNGIDRHARDQLAARLAVDSSDYRRRQRQGNQC